MADLSKSGLFKAFNAALRREDDVQSLDDLLSRMPHLVAQRVTDCGKVIPMGYFFNDKIKIVPGSSEFRDGEINSRMGYLGFVSYWGRGNGSLTTRLVYPSGSNLFPAILPVFLDYQKNNLGPLLDKAFSAAENPDMKFSKEKKVSFGREGSYTKVESFLAEPSKIRGSIKPFWADYWQTVIKPLVQVVHEYREIEKHEKSRHHISDST